MKHCPYCAEEIQDKAIKCRFCGEWIAGEAETMVPKSLTHTVEASAIENKNTLPTQELPRPNEQSPSFLKWVLLYFGVSCVVAVKHLVMGATVDDLFIPKALGEAIAAFGVGLAIGVFAARENKFKTTAVFSLVALILMTLSSGHNQ